VPLRCPVAAKPRHQQSTSVAAPRRLLVGMADASVQFISEKTALEVLLQLAIRNDAQRAKPKKLAADTKATQKATLGTLTSKKTLANVEITR